MGNKYQILQKMIDDCIWIKETFGEGFLKLGELYSISKKFGDYFHDGIYVFDFDLIKGLYFYSVGLNSTKDEKLGPSRGIVPMTISLDSFWKAGEYLMSDFNGYTNDTEIHFLSKDQAFDSTKKYSRYFLIRVLDDIKAHGIKVPDELYPFGGEKNYDYDKTREFIRNNYFKAEDNTIEVDTFKAFKAANKINLKDESKIIETSEKEG